GAWVWAEPLMHPRIFDMIQITHEAGIRRGLSTNATLIDSERADRLLDSGLDYLIIAFDGASKETYEKYRVGATFEKTIENIVAFLEKKSARGSRIHIVLQMVVLKDNVAEIPEYRKLWSIPGVDEIRFKRDEIRVEGTTVPGEALMGQRQHPCHLLWRGPLYVRYDGLVYPCCYMYGGSPVGDLKTQSVMEVWNSAEMVKLREAHLKRDVSEYPACNTCQAARPGRAALYGSLAFHSLTVRKAVPAMERFARFYNVGVFERN